MGKYFVKHKKCSRNRKKFTEKIIEDKKRKALTKNMKYFS